MDRTEGDQDALQDMARDLPELAERLAFMKNEALKQLYSPEYDTPPVTPGGCSLGG